MKNMQGYKSDIEDKTMSFLRMGEKYKKLGMFC